MLLTVEDVMHAGDNSPSVVETATFKELLVEMTRKRLGCAAITDGNHLLVGIFTDGDLRRQIEAQRDLFALHAADVMTRNPKCVGSSQLAVSALAVMEDAKITVLAVTDESGKLAGIVHMHDILSAGAV